MAQSYSESTEKQNIFIKRIQEVFLNATTIYIDVSFILLTNVIRKILKYKTLVTDWFIIDIFTLFCIIFWVFQKNSHIFKINLIILVNILQRCKSTLLMVYNCCWGFHNPIKKRYIYLLFLKKFCWGLLYKVARLLIPMLCGSTLLQAMY